MKKKQLAVRLTAYFLAAATASFGMTGCKQEQADPTENAEYLTAYQQYVESVLDANYLAEYEDYMAMTGATEAQAIDLNKVHVVTLAEQLADLYDIRLEQLPEEIGDTLTEICSDIYKKAGYAVTKVEKVGDDVYVTVVVQPIDFLESASEGVAEYTSDFNDRAKAGEFENMTESQYENEYAKGILDVLEAAVKNVTYSEQITYRFLIQYDEASGVNYIGEDDLDEINQLILAE